jgi:hypothetical protein
MRQHLPFLLILIEMAIVRFVILFVSQTHVTSDEAIIGLMAKHILESRYFPFYFYGTSYNASCAWEALPCRHPVRDRGCWCCHTNNTDGFVVGPLSHSFLHDDNAALLDPRGDIGQPHLRALARATERRRAGRALEWLRRDEDKRSFFCRAMTNGRISYGLILAYSALFAFALFLPEI